MCSRPKPISGRGIWKASSSGTRAAFERDRRRDARLRVAGYTVIRFAAREIEYEPLVVIAQLAQMIGVLNPRPV